jgi:hypothetical protein
VNEPVIPPVTVREPVIRAFPFTSSFAFGKVFPIPTFPLSLLKLRTNEPVVEKFLRHKDKLPSTTLSYQPQP